MSIAARGATKAVSGVVIGVSLAILSGCALLDTAKAFILAPFTGSPFSTVADVPLSGGANRLDYQNFDEKTGRLFIAHLGSSRVHVLDTATNTVIADVPDIAAAHGVLVVPELRRVYASATGAHEVAVLDADTFKVLARVPAGEAPDGLAYAPAAHALFVSNEGGTRQSVIDTETNRRIAELDLGGESGNSQYDAGTGHVMVNIQPRDEIAEIDPLTRRIVARHAITGAGGAHGLLLDQSNRLAYVAGEAASRLTLVDMKTWQVLDTAAVGGMPDVLALDPRRGLVFMASESGTVSVFKAGSRKLEKLAEGYVAPHAHAIAVDPRTHLLYLPIENVDGQPVVRIARYTGEP